MHDFLGNPLGLDKSFVDAKQNLKSLSVTRPSPFPISIPPFEEVLDPACACDQCK
jgi:hypothetical protein